MATASEELRGTNLGPHQQYDAASYSSYVGNVIRKNACRLDSMGLVQTLNYYGRWHAPFYHRRDRVRSLTKWTRSNKWQEVNMTWLLAVGEI